MTSEHTLKIEAARAGVGVGEYQARLRQGLLWCYRCQDWHQAEAFPAETQAQRPGRIMPPGHPRRRPRRARRPRPGPPAGGHMGHPASRAGPAAAARRAAVGILVRARPRRHAGPRPRGGMVTGTRQRRPPVPRPRPGTRRAHHRVRRGRRGPARLPPGKDGLTANGSRSPRRQPILASPAGEMPAARWPRTRCCQPLCPGAYTGDPIHRDVGDISGRWAVHGREADMGTKIAAGEPLEKFGRAALVMRAVP